MFFFQVTTASTGLSTIMIIVIAIGAAACALLVVVIVLSIVIIWCGLSHRKYFNKSEKPGQVPIATAAASRTNENIGDMFSILAPSRYYMEARQAYLYPPIHNAFNSTPINYPQQANNPSANFPAAHTPVVVPSAPPLEVSGQESARISETQSWPQIFVVGKEGYSCA